MITAIIAFLSVLSTLCSSLNVCPRSQVAYSKRQNDGKDKGKSNCKIHELDDSNNFIIVNAKYCHILNIISC